MKAVSAWAVPACRATPAPFQAERQPVSRLIDSGLPRGYNLYPQKQSRCGGVGRWLSPVGNAGPRTSCGSRGSDGQEFVGRFFHTLILNMRSAMNRFKLWSGGLAASLMVLVTASAAAQGAGEWTMTGRTPDLQRYSPLTQINKANVKNLKAAWTFSTGVLNGHEGNPLVIGNVMYVHSAFPNIVFALDLTKDGAPMIWKHTPAQPAEAKPIACCDLVNRGVAYHPSGKLFIELLAGDLLALDAKTGKQLWRVPNADYKTGSTMTNAPIVIKDIVIAGISGGEFVVRRHPAAHTKLTARNPRDHDVFDHDRSVGHRGAGLVVGVGDAPDLLAALRIERQQVARQQLDEQLAARMVGETAVHQVAAGDRLRLGRLGRHSPPDHRRARLREIECGDGVRERAVHVHHVVEHQRISLVAVQDAGRER